MARFLTIPQAAQRCGLSETTLRRLSRDGHLPVVRIGRRTLIADVRLDQWIAEANGNVRARVYDGAELERHLT
jgi:excisionase family DNA binding protein